MQHVKPQALHLWKLGFESHMQKSQVDDGLDLKPPTGFGLCERTEINRSILVQLCLKT